MNHIGNSAALNSSTIVLAARRSLVSSLKGMSGSAATRLSITPKATSSATPTAIGPRAANVSQPFSPASTIPFTSTIWPIVRVSAPATSKLRPRSRRRSRTTAKATAAAASAIGGLINSTQRQLSTSVITPPSSTPAAPPRPFIAAHIPIARWSRGPGSNEAVMIASEHAAISAPASPWKARAAISTPWLGAAPPASEVAANSTSAATKVRRCP